MRCVQMIVALGIATQASCVSTPPVPDPVAPRHADVPRVELLAPAVDLSGGWATGSANEPPAGPVVQHPSCAYNPAVWIVQQSGNTLKTWAFPESFNQGIKRAEPGPERVVPSPGTISGAEVLIADAETRLVLRYDAASGHLRGTRNGKPFWAAPQKIVRSGACPGIP